jgi:hypothetical protein
VKIKGGLVALLEFIAWYLENGPRLGAGTAGIDDDQGPATARGEHGRHSIRPGGEQPHLLRIAAKTPRLQQVQNLDAGTVIEAIWVSTSDDDDHLNSPA